VEYQRDLDDVYRRENYLLLLVTHPRYQNKFPALKRFSAGNFRMWVRAAPRHQDHKAIVVTSPP
jgi:hypothetical protein